MAFDSLASTADLDARGITLPDALDGDTLLASASEAVRDAAGCPISEADSTVDLYVDDLCEIDLPGGPVTEVASVTLEGVTVAAATLTGGCWSDGWRRSGNSVLLKGQWAELPAKVTVVYTHGFATVPGDIVDLVCSMVAIAVQTGYGTTERLQSFRLGDYSESFTPTAGSDSPSPVSLPDSVRERLRARFGTSAAMVRIR